MKSDYVIAYVVFIIFIIINGSFATVINPICTDFLAGLETNWRSDPTSLLTNMPPPNLGLSNGTYIFYANGSNGTEYTSTAVIGLPPGIAGYINVDIYCFANFSEDFIVTVIWDNVTQGPVYLWPDYSWGYASTKSIIATPGLHTLELKIQSLWPNNPWDKQLSHSLAIKDIYATGCYFLIDNSLSGETIFLIFIGTCGGLIFLIFVFYLISKICRTRKSAETQGLMLISD